MMTRSARLLYGGDVIAIFLFAAVGRNSHQLAVGADTLLATFNTAAPFIIGWLLVAPWLGAFRPQAVANTKAAIRIVAISILPSLVVGALVRALFEGHLGPWTFYVVTALFLALFLMIWRLAYTWFLAAMR